MPNNTSSTGNTSSNTSTSNSANNSIRSRNVSSGSHRSLRQFSTASSHSNPDGPTDMDAQFRATSGSGNVEDGTTTSTTPPRHDGRDTPTDVDPQVDRQSPIGASPPLGNKPQDESPFSYLFPEPKKLTLEPLWNAQLTLGNISRYILWFLVCCVVIHIPFLVGKLTPPAGFRWDVASFILECFIVASYSLLTIIATLRQLCYRIPLFTPLRAFFAILGYLYALICAATAFFLEEKVSKAIVRTSYGFVGIMGGWALIHTVWNLCEKVFAHHQGNQERFLVYAHECLAKSALNDLTTNSTIHKLTFSQKGARVFCFSCKPLFKNLRSTETVNNMLKLRDLLMLDCTNESEVSVKKSETRLTRKELHSRVYRVYLDLAGNYSEGIIQHLISEDQGHLDRPDERMTPFTPYSKFSKLFI